MAGMAHKRVSAVPSVPSPSIPMAMAQPYEVVASFLLANTSYRPVIGIICGSGLSGLSKNLTQTQTFKYEDIPGFPEATVPGHTGELVFGLLGDLPCVCMRGRFHFYEGNSMEKVVLPVRVMRLIGVKLLVVTNAAGGLNSNYNVGDIVIIQDHFGLVNLPIYSTICWFTHTYHCYACNLLCSHVWLETLLFVVSTTINLVLASLPCLILTIPYYKKWSGIPPRSLVSLTECAKTVLTAFSLVPAMKLVQNAASYVG
jgi:hypothetical protein